MPRRAAVVPGWVHRAAARARMVSTAVSRGRVSRWTCARRSPPCSAARSVTARSSGLLPAREVPGDLESPQAVADGGGPPREAGRDKGAGLGVAFGKLAAQRPEGAASLAIGAPGPGDDHVAPGAESFDGTEVGIFGVADDSVGLVVDDRLHELVLVSEIVVELRTADLCRRPDVLQGGAGHPALVDQHGGSTDDPGAGPLTLGGQPGPVTGVVRHAFRLSVFWV